MDSSENNDVKMSELIFIRNGKVFRKSFPYEQDLRIFPEEEKLLMQSLGVSKEEFDKMDNVEKYAALTDSGWTIIRNINEYSYDNSIYIGNQITQGDYDAIMQMFSSKEGPIKVDSDKVYSRTNYKYGRQFEAVSIRDVTAKEIVDIFMRDKLGQTTEYEKEMLEHFRTFDLERILTGADASYRINNRSGGVIIITPDEFLTNACSGENAAHGTASSSIFMNKYNEIYRKNTETMFMFEADRYKSVIIQCSNIQEEGELIVWTPGNMNEFQYDKLLELQDSLEQIEQKTGKEIRVCFSFAGKQQDGDERTDSPRAYKNFLLQKHDLIVDESKDYYLKKSSMPEYNPTTEKELCDSLGIKMPNIIGRNVKDQLFDEAKKGLNLFTSDIFSLFKDRSKENEYKGER